MIPNGDVMKRRIVNYLRRRKFTKVRSTASGILREILPEIEALMKATENAARQKQTRPEWLAPLILPAPGDDEDPRHPGTNARGEPPERKE